MKYIIFVSEMRDPYGNASSTQIMTRNIMKGLMDNCEELVFVCILEKGVSFKHIDDFYGGVSNRILFINDGSKDSTWQII